MHRQRSFGLKDKIIVIPCGGTKLKKKNISVEKSDMNRIKKKFKDLSGDTRSYPGMGIVDLAEKRDPFQGEWWPSIALEISSRSLNDLPWDSSENSLGNLLEKKNFGKQKKNNFPLKFLNGKEMKKKMQLACE